MNQTTASCSRWKILFLSILLALLGGACAVFGTAPSAKPDETTAAVEGASAAASPTAGRTKPTATQTKPAPKKATATKVATVKPPVGGKPNKSSGSTDLFKDFPLYKGSKVDPGGTSSDEKGGNIRIVVNANPADVSAFYEKALPEQGWQERLSEATLTGGFKQTWVKDQSYLTLEYVFEDSGPAVQGRIEMVNRELALRDLPRDFPIPDGAELVQASSTSFTFDVPLDFDKTIAQYQQLASARSWKANPSGGMSGSCGGDCGDGEAAQRLNGLTPLPTMTMDPRKSKGMSYFLPDGTQVDLDFSPVRDHTRIYVSITWKDAARAGLPVQIYPGATIQSADPGMAMFEVKAALKDVVAFYEDALKADGWTADAFGVNTAGSYVQNWTKGKQGLTISLTTYAGKVAGVISCTNCAAK